MFTIEVHRRAYHQGVFLSETLLGVQGCLFIDLDMELYITIVFICIIGTVIEISVGVFTITTF